MVCKHFVAGLLISVAAANLDKPPLHQNLDYLNQGLLNNLRPTHSNWDEWGAGWLPKDCVDMTRNAGLDPRDVKAYNVHYDDCGDAWVICRHNAVPDPLINMIDLFGRLPVNMRNWVRHVINLPDSSGHAYNAGGNIAMFNRVNGDMNVWVHETGHSLDLLGAFSPDKPLSNSGNWINNYNQDQCVPDPYAQTNQVENVAQNTVVSLFDRVVPNGFGSVEPNWNKIFHQYATLQWEADNGGNLLRPGGTCSRRLTNSAPQQVGTRKRTTKIGPAPDVSLSSAVEIIEAKEFDTRKLGCSYTGHSH